MPRLAWIPPSEDPRLAKLVCNVARYTLAVAVLHLDATGGPDGSGATAAGLRAMLTTGQFASDGWVKNAVRVFARAGYFERHPARGDRRAIRVAPSEMMIRIAQEAMMPKFAAMELLSPLPLPAEELARYPGFIAAMATHAIVPYLTDGFTELEGFPENSRACPSRLWLRGVLCNRRQHAARGGRRHRRGGALSLALAALRHVAQPVAEHPRSVPCRRPDHRDRPGRPPGDAGPAVRRSLPSLCRLRHRLLNRMVRAAARDVGLATRPRQLLAIGRRDQDCVAGLAGRQ